MESGREAIIPLQEIDLCKIMKCDKQERINNLQSKIDKANEILNRPQFEYDNIPCNYEEDIEELKNVLKEVENVENN